MAQIDARAPSSGSSSYTAVADRSALVVASPRHLPLPRPLADGALPPSPRSRTRGGSGRLAGAPRPAGLVGGRLVTACQNLAERSTANGPVHLRSLSPSCSNRSPPSAAQLKAAYCRIDWRPAALSARHQEFRTRFRFPLPPPPVGTCKPR
jgi:hypothetical protein